MNPSIKHIFYIFITCTLTACLSQVNPPGIQPYLNKPIPSKIDLFVVESHQTSGLPALMAPNLDLRYPDAYFPASADKIPNVTTYLKNPGRWQQWKKAGFLGTDYRIAGLLPHGTLIIIKKYRIPSFVEDMLDANTMINILIANGLFKNKNFSIDTVMLKEMFGIEVR
ncbi:MAG: hypothetical protein ACYCQI_14525 [Gammaproteobacteria bacterium]